MKSFKIKILFIVTMLLLNCKTIVKKAYGVKDPKVENSKTIAKFLEKNNMNSNRNLIFKSFQDFAQASQKGLISVPNITLFNENGYFVNYQKTPEDCNSKVDDFLMDLKHFENYPFDETKNITDFTKYLELEDNQIIDTTEINAFITWAVFAGSLNKDKAFEWVYLLEKAKKEGVKINYYLVNCDLQTSWNLTDEQVGKIQKAIKG